MGNSGGRGRGYGGRRGGRGGNASFDPLACYRCGCAAIWLVTVLAPVISRRPWEVAIPALPVEHSPNPGKKAQEDVAEVAKVRFGALNMLYDEDGNSYPVDDVGQLYIPLELAQDVDDSEFEEKKTKGTKN